MRAILLTLLLCLPAAADVAVYDPSGESHPVIVVIDGKATWVHTVPITGDAPAPPTPSEPEPPPPPTETPDVLGFVAVARSSSALMPESDRVKAAAIFANVADRHAEWPDHAAMKSYTDQQLTGAIDVSDASPAGPFLEAVQAKLSDLWNTAIVSPADLATAWREIAAGLGDTP